MNKPSKIKGSRILWCDPVSLSKWFLTFRDPGVFILKGNVIMVDQELNSYCNLGRFVSSHLKSFKTTGEMGKCSG